MDQRDFVATRCGGREFDKSGLAINLVQYWSKKGDWRKKIFLVSPRMPC